MDPRLSQLIDDTIVIPEFSPDADKAEKKRLKKLEREQELSSLDPWERYRMLTDQFRQYLDLVELADRKARFGLVLIGAVNAINLLILVRPELLTGDSMSLPTGMALYVLLYISLSLFLFYQAIRELKPRLAPHLPLANVPSSEMLGLRFIGDVAGSGRTEYYEKWQTAQFGQVNREIAYSIQTIAQALTVKYQALESLFNGLFVLVTLTAGLLLYLIYLQA